MICKVIATSFNGRQVRKEEVYPGHPQVIEHPGEALQLLKDVVEFEKKEDAGIPLDVIIVNNDTNFKEGNEYIASLDGEKTKNGKIIAYTRPNIGWSFGAHNDAFKRFHDDYDYWIFTEDDILVGGIDYAKKLKERWEDIEKAQVPVGFLSLIGVIRHAQYGIHCGGAVGMSSRPVLDKVVEKFGCLPHHDKPESDNLSANQNKQNAILNGEVAFTQRIDDLGFYLINYGPNTRWSMGENSCLPYYYLKEELNKR